MAGINQLQLPSQVNVGSPDFSPLARLADTYRQAQLRAELQGMAANGQKPSLQDVSMAALRHGDTGAFANLAQLANANALSQAQIQNMSAQQEIARGNQEIARQGLVPQDVRKLVAGGVDPRSERGQRVLAGDSAPLTATDRTAIHKVEDQIPTLQATLRTLDRAAELNDKTFTGGTASLRGEIGAKWLPEGVARAIPGLDPASAKATSEWEQLMGAEAIKAMSEQLKGASTNFEMQQYLRRIADPSTPPEARKRLIGEMRRTVQQEMGIQQNRMNQLRGGTYYKPTGGASGDPGVAPAAAQPRAQAPSFNDRFAGAPDAKPITKAEFDLLRPGDTFVAPDGTVRTKP
jgi:hypothetical protein